MFQQLHQYLLQFHQVALPNVGTLQLVAQPATYNVVDHLIYPPSYQTRFTPDVQLTAHQITYFEQYLGVDEHGVLKKLEDAGQALLSDLDRAAFLWNGVGRFEQGSNGLAFTAIQPAAAQPVAAHKVHRENAQHQVLVGDQMITSEARRTIEEEAEAKKSTLVLIGWILALLALLFIAYYLYTHNYNPTSSGLQKKVAVGTPAPTYK